MTDHPILFSAPMVRALLEGRKTQTRRLAWGKHYGIDDIDDEEAEKLRAMGLRVSGEDDTGARIIWPQTNWQKITCGDRLWVREAWRVGPGYDDLKPSQIEPASWLLRHYEADGAQKVFGKLRPGIFMPRWLSRLTLTVTGTRLQPLHAMGEDDAKAEGSEAEGYLTGQLDEHGNEIERASHFIGFSRLWADLHGQECWDANPDVVAITVTVAKANIDAVVR